ncbi:endonuclease domain-containing protein [Longimicrobium sp.]|uniref:endonuclease domain-containing protein n=1 Tax=Longimicrobium sp. TaxID=2029185 RepID=UPI002E3015C3|nr:endonuclease domain-containing protein [Longimicrobium sp.]HEX6036442.1 endonuclease domain-containing protein [Longimicrobium sp.]
MRIKRRWRTHEGVQEAAKALRKDMTEAERVLWSALRGEKVGGLRFRRQHAVGPFILDFYCPSARLGIELDGPIHEAQRELDQARTEALETQGIRIIRFPNERVMADLESVLQDIRVEIGRLQVEELSR